MNIQLQIPSRSDRNLIRRLMELYQYDFSEFDGQDLDEHGHLWFKDRRGQSWQTAYRGTFTGTCVIKTKGIRCVKDSSYSFGMTARLDNKILAIKWVWPPFIAFIAFQSIISEHQIQLKEAWHAYFHDWNKDSCGRKHYSDRRHTTCWLERWANDFLSLWHGIQD